MPSAAAQALRDIPRLLTRDVAKARNLLQKLVGDITMMPVNGRLEARLTGNLAGTVRMASGEALVVAGDGFAPV